MLAEYNFPLQTSTSSWSDEPLLLGNDEDLFQLDVEMAHLGSDDDRLESLAWTSTFDPLDDYVDCSISPHGERCFQQDSNRNRLEGVFGSPDSDYLTGVYLSALQDNETTEDEAQFAAELLQSDLDVAYSVDLSDSDDSFGSSSQSTVNSCPGSPTAKRKKMHDLQWSEMDMEEQQRAVEEIKKAITDQSSIREQLELLRIIGQDMTVLPSDSRFTINAAYIDNSKLQSIREYLAQMALHTAAASEETTCTEKHHSTSSNQSRHKKSLERRSRHKAHRKRRTKEKKQTLKEEQSRLFALEEVLSLQVQDDDNDEEINVLD
ncbi:uncharacterized protein [Asterias amurensis]|uniref:uncharacterized protein n=1 Tax=Asterias amurensis TaxID=7602 RepID=UPI003AB7072C